MHAPNAPDAGQHDTVGVGDQPRVGGQARVGTHVLDRLVRRVEVADAVVEHGHQRTVLTTPPSRFCLLQTARGFV